MKRLDCVRELYEQVIVGPLVKLEVLDQGKAIAAPGVEQVENALEERWIQPVRLTKKEKSLFRAIMKSSRLDAGEAESIAIARSRRLLFIVDDKEARAHSDLMAVEYVGTAGVLLEAFLRGHTTLEGLEEAVQELSRTMWLSPGVVCEVLRIAREGKR